MADVRFGSHRGIVRFVPYGDLAKFLASWLGRGDGELSDWDDLRKEAARLHNERTAAYLLGNPMLGDHLEEGLEIFGISGEGM